MVGYVEGIVVPVPTDRRDDYRAMSAAVAALYLEHGATRAVESWGEDIDWGERTSFPRAVELTEGENVVFSWMEFPDAATCAACHERVWSDPRIEALRDDSLLDGARMIRGGFAIIQDMQ